MGGVGIGVGQYLGTTVGSLFFSNLHFFPFILFCLKVSQEKYRISLIHGKRGNSCIARGGVGVAYYWFSVFLKLAIFFYYCV